MQVESTISLNFDEGLMNIPNLPTDNLYKFMALSGLFIFILSMFYPIS